MKRLIMLCLSLSAALNSFACLNGEYRELKDGSLLFEDAEADLIPRGHSFSSKREFETALVQLDSLWKTTHDVAYYSDYGLVLIMLKRYDEALAVYQQIENSHPGRYSTASNMGTLYELMGQNENALKWIERAVEIDPASHKASEWIHVNILKAKIQGEDYINGKFLIGHDFENYDAPRSALSKEELRTLREALYYQLNERVSFIAPPDKIIAALMFELGNITWLIGDGPSANILYKKAEEYGANNDLLKLRKHAVIDYTKRGLVIDPNPVVRNFSPLYFVLAACGLAMVWMAWSKSRA